MKSIIAITVFVFGLLLTAGCTSKEEKTTLPTKSPGEVVKRFFELLGEGGKITNREAFQMVASNYRTLDPTDFRKWTESFNRESKIKVVEEILPDKPDNGGNMTAVVKMEVLTPSMFDDYFTTTSKMHLLLDKETNEWKIDFMADTIDEADYINAPAEARAGVGEMQKRGGGK